MRDGLESLDHLAADTLGRGIGGHQFRMRRFERLELAHQRVELDVRDLRIRVNVVAVFVIADPLAKLVDALARRHTAKERYRSRSRTNSASADKAARSGPSGNADNF